MFDAAVIARTLYTGLGPKGWRLYIAGLGSRLPLRLITESRIPVRVAKTSIVMDTVPSGPGPVYVVDPRGRPAWKVDEEPGLLLVDYSDMLRRPLGAKPVSTLGAPSITYEATVAIYEFFVRRRLRPAPRGRNAFSPDPRRGSYLARKLLEAVSVFDNYVVLEPSVVAYTLKRVLLAQGLIVDPAGYRVEIEPLGGSVVERIELDVYDRRLKEKGRAEVVFNGSLVSVTCCGEELFRIEIDPERRVACSAPGLCVGESGGGEAWQGLPQWS